MQALRAAQVNSWAPGKECAFITDTLADLVLLLDYLCHRPDVDATAIGATGTKHLSMD